MSFFKTTPSVRKQVALWANHQQIRQFEEEILKHAISSSTDALDFRLWLENPSSPMDRYHVGLSHLKWFEIQTNDDATAYGGNQYWWKHKHFFNAGCGTIAACNMIYYIARRTQQTNLLRQVALCPENDLLISQDDFMIYMDDMVQYVTPTFEGIATAAYFQRGLEKYIHSLGRPTPAWFFLSASNKTDHSIFEATSFIRQHLKANRPIACLHWFQVGHMQVFNPSEAKETFTDMNWHWVTITELYQTKDNWRIVVSSCGVRYELDFLHFLCGKPSLVTIDL